MAGDKRSLDESESSSSVESKASRRVGRYSFSADGRLLDNQSTSAQTSNRRNAPVIISSIQDFEELSQQESANGSNNQVALTRATTNAIDTFYQPGVIQRFTTNTNISEERSEEIGNNILQKLTQVLKAQGISIGFLDKLLMLQDRQLNYILDDSGSMTAGTDVNYTQAHPEMRERLYGADPRYAYMTRWNEIEDRLHFIVDILVYVPTKTIKFSFINRSDEIILTPEERKEKSPEECRQMLHTKLSDIFSQGPSGRTPLYSKLRQSMNQSGKHMHYVYTDGQPTDCSIEQFKQMVIARPTPENHAILFGSCSDKEADIAWMKGLDNNARFVGEIDDFKSEAKEVSDAQGESLPFNRGTMRMCELVAPIDPRGLDALDENKILSAEDFSLFIGRRVDRTAPEYQDYTQAHPMNRRWGNNNYRYAQHAGSSNFYSNQGASAGFYNSSSASNQQVTSHLNNNSAPSCTIC